MLTVPVFTLPVVINGDYYTKIIQDGYVRWLRKTASSMMLCLLISCSRFAMRADNAAISDAPAPAPAAAPTAAPSPWGLANVARHVTGCHLASETRVGNHVE